MKRLRGFTVIELLVVLVVIGVLAAITTVGFSQYQATTRDAQRLAKATVIAEALEKYYEQHGEYPGCNSVTGTPSTVTGSGGALESVDPLALITPQANSGVGNSIECSDLTSLDDDDIFAYVGDGSPTCQSGSSCLEFTLKYKDEITGEIASISSRHSTDIDTSGIISDLNATATGLSQISVTWSSLPNALSYELQRATNSTFTTNLSTTSGLTTTSQSVTGLSQGTTYYFRVVANSATGQGNWSNTDSATTQSLATPSISATAVSNSQINVTWSDINYEDSYRLQYTTSSSSWSSPTPTSISLSANSTSRSVTGLNIGVTYYFRLQGLKTEGGTQYSSSWSATASDTTFVPAPTTITATTNSSTQITADWSDVSVAQTYTLEYSVNSNFSGASTITGITDSVRAVTGLTQGERYYFRVYALVGSTSSDASPSANAATTVNTPGAPGITAYRPNAVRAYASGYWVAWINSPASGNWYYAYGSSGGSCPGGTTRIYQFAARYNSPSTTYYTGETTAQTWYMAQPSSGYRIKFSARMYCAGSDANSGWSGWSESCAANPGSTVTCTF